MPSEQNKVLLGEEQAEAVVQKIQYLYKDIKMVLKYMLEIIRMN